MFKNGSFISATWCRSYMKEYEKQGNAVFMGFVFYVLYNLEMYSFTDYSYNITL